MDDRDHVYIFHAIEFDYFIRLNGAWNPYNKDVIPEYVITQLKLLMKYNNLSCRNQEYNWTTALHAYTDVSQIMEKAGFYNDVKWFQKLTINSYKRVIRLFQDLCYELPDASSYFPIDFQLTEESFVFEFSKETIRLFENSENHYLLCCNFVKALAFNSNEFYDNLPTWLLNISSSILNLNVNNGIMLLYIDNILDNILNDDEIMI